MMDSQLFFGSSLSPILQKEFSYISEKRKEFFIQEHGIYLHPLFHEGILYLGKFITPPIHLKNLPNLSEHILSLFEKLFSHNVREELILVLIALLKEEGTE